VSNNLIREHTDLQAEASALRQLATELVRELRIARTDAYGTDHAESDDVFDLAASILDNRRAGQPLLEEVARLRAQLAELSRQIGEQHTTIGYQDAMLAKTDADLAILRELASDVARWRETGGDPRDLRYILETADRYEAMKAGKE